MRVPEIAGSLTFTTVLALVPIITIALAIMTAFPLFDNFKVSLEAYFIQTLMPKGISNTILGYLTQFATKATRLSAVGGVFLILTAVMTMAMIDKTFNEIWKVKRKRPLRQRIIVYWAIVTLGPLLIGISMSTTSYLFTAANDVVTSLPFVGVLFYSLITVAFSTFAFALLYIAVPNCSVDWLDAVWGGFFAAISFEIAKRLFAVFIKQFPTYTVIYGALAAMPIFLIWVYLSWIIILFGAVLSAALPIVKFERWWHVPTPGSAFEDAIAVLRVLVNAHNANTEAVVDVASIRIQTRFGLDEIEGLLEKMLETGWVARIVSDAPQAAGKSSNSRWWKKTNAGKERWILVMNPAALALSDVYRLFVFDATKESGLANKVNLVISNGLTENLHEYFLVR